MKFISALVLPAVLLSQTANASDPSSVGGSTTSSTIKAAPPSLRGARSESEPSAVGGDATLYHPQRQLLRPDETCYAYVQGDDIVRQSQVECTLDLLGSCNDIPVCASSQQDAVNSGSNSCTTWTVWYNEESTCQWQYMCCNQ